MLPAHGDHRQTSHSHGTGGRSVGFVGKTSVGVVEPERAAGKVVPRAFGHGITVGIPDPIAEGAVLRAGKIVLTGRVAKTPLLPVHKLLHESFDSLAIAIAVRRSQGQDFRGRGIGHARTPLAQVGQRSLNGLMLDADATLEYGVERKCRLAIAIATRMKSPGSIALLSSEEKLHAAINGCVYAELHLLAHCRREFQLAPQLKTPRPATVGNLDQKVIQSLFQFELEGVITVDHTPLHVGTVNQLAVEPNPATVITAELDCQAGLLFGAHSAVEVRRRVISQPSVVDSLRKVLGKLDVCRAGLGPRLALWVEPLPMQFVAALARMGCFKIGALFAGAHEAQLLLGRVRRCDLTGPLGMVDGHEQHPRIPGYAMSFRRDRERLGGERQGQ